VRDNVQQCEWWAIHAFAKRRSPVRFRSSALYNKGLVPYSSQYVSVQNSGPGIGWPNTEGNWNSVCNSALLAASLAIAGELSASQQTLLSQLTGWAFKSLVNGIDEIGLDGGFPEGTNYWSYANRYLTVLMSSFETATGSDLSLGNLSSIADSGNYMFSLIEAPLSPVTSSSEACGIGANFADAPSTIGNQSALFYYASRFNNSAYLAAAEGCSTSNPPNFGSAAFLFEAQTEQKNMLPSSTTSKALDQQFAPVTGVVALHSSWSNPQAASAFFKGGSIEQEHGRLDLGGIIYDWAGTRWIEEPANDNYNLPGYFDATQRWTYYRNSTIGQSTLAFCTQSSCSNSFLASTADFCGLTKCSSSGSFDAFALTSFNENTAASATFGALSTEAASGSVSLNLNGAHPGVAQWTRSVTLGASTKYGDRTNLNVKDTFSGTSSASCTYAWVAQTSVSSVQVASNGASVTLSDGKGHTVVIQKDPSQTVSAGSFHVQNIVLDSPQNIAATLKRISYEGTCTSSSSTYNLSFIVVPQ
jgi:hypothetical protein